MSAVDTMKIATVEPRVSHLDQEHYAMRRLAERFVPLFATGLLIVAAVLAAVELASSLDRRILVGLFVPTVLMCLLAGFLVQVARREALVRPSPPVAAPARAPRDNVAVYDRPPLAMGPPVSA